MRRPCAAALLLVLGIVVHAQPLVEIPPRWSGIITPIPQQRLAELEEATAARIRETRGRLNAILVADATTAGEIAAVYGRLGALYAAHRLYAGAELSLRNATALDPDAFQWRYYAAHIALEQGEAEQALGHLTEATRLDPAYPTLPLRRGEALLDLNRLAEARAAYEQAMETTDLRAAALYGLGQIDLLERDWTAAAARLGEVLTLQPRADAVHYPLGQALARLGRRDEAREHLVQRGRFRPEYADPLVEELRSLQVGARYHFEQGVAAVARRDYGAAATAFAAGLAEDPTNVRARTSHARALWISGRTAEAVAEFERVIVAAPEETLPRFLLAVVRDAAGDPAAAIAGYREVLAIDPDHEGALSYLANLGLRQGDYAAAAAHFERAIESGVTQMPVFLHYWGALLHAGVDDAALRERLVAFDRRFPEPPVFRYLLAKLLLSSAERGVADADRALEIARELHAAQPVAPHTELLALALAATGDFALAQELQGGLVEMARTTGAFYQAAALEAVAAAYSSGQLPEPVWSRVEPMFMPPPLDPETAMINYPAGQPY